jgi:2'-5' RNA ligase
VDDGKFGGLFTAGRAALLTGTHQVRSAPADGDLQWGASVILRPDPDAAEEIERVALDAASVVGTDHWLPGSSATSHLTVRAHLEPRRAEIPDDDPLAARYAAALRRAASDPQPMRFTLTGLTLTPVSVMACAVPATRAADELADAFAEQLATAGLPGIGRPADIWYVNLVYFAGPVRDASALVDWVAARRTTPITEVRVTEIQLTRWRYAESGMVPVPMMSIKVPDQPSPRLSQPTASSGVFSRPYRPVGATGTLTDGRRQDQIGSLVLVNRRFPVGLTSGIHNPNLKVRRPYPYGEYPNEYAWS